MFVLCRQEKVAVGILVLVAGVCLAGTILLDGVGKEPFSAEYKQGLPDQTLVSWSGVVGSLYTAKGGSVMLEVSGVRVFIPASAGLLPDIREGSRISMIGIIQHYNGEEEILVEDISDIRVIS